MCEHPINFPWSFGNYHAGVPRKEQQTAAPDESVVLSNTTTFPCRTLSQLTIMKMKHVKSKNFNKFFGHHNFSAEELIAACGMTKNLLKIIWDKYCGTRTQSANRTGA